jgi:fatty acid desaturase
MNSFSIRSFERKTRRQKRARVEPRWTWQSPSWWEIGFRSRSRSATSQEMRWLSACSTLAAAKAPFRTNGASAACFSFGVFLCGVKCMHFVTRIMQHKGVPPSFILPTPWLSLVSHATLRLTAHEGGGPRAWPVAARATQ